MRLTRRISRSLKSLTYHAPDRTLTDKDVAKIRQHILHQLGRDLGAKLRS
jgi:phenylalanyl-tRNA synthetase beta subunit